MVLSQTQLNREAGSSNSAVAANAIALGGVASAPAVARTSRSSSSGSLRSSKSAFDIIDDIRASQTSIQTITQASIDRDIATFFRGEGSKTSFDIIDDIRAGFTSGALKSKPQDFNTRLQQEITQAIRNDQFPTELVSQAQRLSAAFEERDTASIESQKTFFDKLKEGYASLDNSLGGILPGGTPLTKGASFNSGFLLAGAAVVALLLFRKKSGGITILK